MPLKTSEILGSKLSGTVTLFDDVPRLLRWLRIRAERKQHEAAKFLGVSPTAVSRYENGEIEIPLDTFDRLLVYYGIASLAQLEEEVTAMRSGSRPQKRVAIAPDAGLSKDQILELLLENAQLRREAAKKAATESASPQGEHDPSRR